MAPNHALLGAAATNRQDAGVVSLAPLKFDATLVPGRGVARLPHLDAFLGFSGSVVRGSHVNGGIDSVAGWGFKPTARRARAIAERHGLPYLALEDGFFRSVGLGETGAPPTAIVADDLGIYYDARVPSRLEALLAGEGWETPELLARAEAAIAFVVRYGLSKTNADPSLDPAALAGARRRVLIADQTAGDVSIEGALAGPDTFRAMIAAARRDEPDAELLVRRHPAVAAGVKQGCIAEAELAGVTLLDAPARIADVLARVDAVYTVSSLTGFEALLRGVPVRCFGMPFYAGWGLTRDEMTVARRGRMRTLPELFAAACILYSHYVDPLTGERCEIETALERLLGFRTHSDANAGLTAALGFTMWKRAVTRKHLSSARGQVRFHRDPDSAERDAVAHDGRVVVWGGKETAEWRARLSEGRAPVWRMEDGFIRSAGLGSDFNLAASVVLDDLGIYYDASGPSRLEAILEAGDFAPDLLARAAALRSLIVESGVSKYNVGRVERLAVPAGRQGLLVVGQVEDDKSIRLGCEPDLNTNLALIAAARRDHPDAWLIYKPHPDVAAGNRIGGVAAEALAGLADAVADDIDIVSCLASVERLATLTSLAGFEALLRGVAVSTYGRPFYAGWGLTSDRLAIQRRTRALSIDALVAGTLLAYPRYIDPVSGLPCPPEQLIALLRAAPPGARRARRLRWLAALVESLRPSRVPRY